MASVKEVGRVAITTNTITSTASFLGDVQNSCHWSHIIFTTSLAFSWSYSKGTWRWDTSSTISSSSWIRDMVSSSMARSIPYFYGHVHEEGWGARCHLVLPSQTAVEHRTFLHLQLDTGDFSTEVHGQCENKEKAYPEKWNDLLCWKCWRVYTQQINCEWGGTPTDHE